MQRASPPPWPLTLASESRLAGSAGTTTSTVRVSAAITPTGMPPSLQGGPQVGRGTGQHPRLVQGAGGSSQPRLISTGTRAGMRVDREKCAVFNLALKW